MSDQPVKPPPPSRPAKLDDATRKALLARAPSVQSSSAVAPAVSSPSPVAPSSSSTPPVSAAADQATVAKPPVEAENSNPTTPAPPAEAPPAPVRPNKPNVSLMHTALATSTGVPPRGPAAHQVATIDEDSARTPPSADYNAPQPGRYSLSGMRGGHLVTPAVHSSYLPTDDADFSTVFQVPSNVRKYSEAPSSTSSWEQQDHVSDSDSDSDEEYFDMNSAQASGRQSREPERADPQDHFVVPATASVDAAAVAVAAIAAASVVAVHADADAHDEAPSAAVVVESEASTLPAATTSSEIEEPAVSPVVEQSQLSVEPPPTVAVAIVIDPTATPAHTRHHHSSSGVSAHPHLENYEHMGVAVALAVTLLQPDEDEDGTPITPEQVEHRAAEARAAEILAEATQEARVASARSSISGAAPTITRSSRPSMAAFRSSSVSSASPEVAGVHTSLPGVSEMVVSVEQHMVIDGPTSTPIATVIRDRAPSAAGGMAVGHPSRKPSAAVAPPPLEPVVDISAPALPEFAAIQPLAAPTEFEASLRITPVTGAGDKEELLVSVEIQFQDVAVTASDSASVALSSSSSDATKVESISTIPSAISVSSSADAAFASPAATAAPVSPVEKGPPSSTQYLISKEIYDTELRFIDNLSLLHEVFIVPAASAVRTRDEKSMGNIVFDPRVQVFFSTASQILKLNSRFLNELKLVMEEWGKAENKTNVSAPPTVPTVGHVFLNYVPLFKLFSAYAKDHEIVSAMLITASQVKNSAFEKFCTKSMTEGCTKGQTLESLLIQPIQRIPRYKLLLEELKRKSNVSQRGYAELLTAIEQVGDVAVHVNETIRHREQNELLRLIEDRFVVSASTGFKRLYLRDQEPPRQLLREGSLKRLTRKGNTTYYFHLFNDMLLYSEETVTATGKQYKLHRKVSFYESVAITDKSSSTANPAPPITPTASASNDGSIPAPLSPVANQPNSGQQAIEVRSPAKSFIIVFPSAQEKILWLGDLHRCVETIKKEKAANMEGKTDGSGDFVAPVWAQDRESATCTQCTKDFTLFNRRHHCRQCGAIVCGLCSKNKRMIPSVDSKNPVRVCNNCAKEAYDAKAASAAPTSEAPATGVSSSSSSSSGANNISSPSPANVHFNKRASVKPMGISAFLGGSPVPGTRSSLGTAPSIAEENHPSATSGVTSKRSSVVSENGAEGAAGADESINEDGGDGSSMDEVPIPQYRRVLFSLTRYYRNNERLLNAVELYLSEITYCKELEVLLNDFVTPLQKQMVTKNNLLGGGTQTLLLGKPVPPHLLLFLNSFQPLYTLALELHKCLHQKIITGDVDGGADTTAASSSSPQASPRASLTGGSNSGVPAGWNPDKTTFGELFLRYANLFDLYAEYAQNHKQAVDSLTDLSTPFYKEVFLKYETIIKSRVNDVVAEQTLISEAAKRMEAEWARTDDMLYPKSKLHQPRELETGDLDVAALDASIAAARGSSPSTSLGIPGVTSTVSRPSVAATGSIGGSGGRGSATVGVSGGVQLDEPPLHTSLHDLFTSPFMRVSKYVWLLSSLLRATPEGHPDNIVSSGSGGAAAGSDKQLAAALKAVQNSLNRINASILVGDNLASLTKLQDKFVGSSKEIDLVAPHRHLLKEGMLLRHTRNGATNYYFHLFSDLLIYSEVTVQGKYKIHRRLPLLTVSVFPANANSGVDPSVSMEIHSPIKSFVVVAKDETEKDAWLEEIMLAIKAEERKANDAAQTLSPNSAAAPKAQMRQRESILLNAAPVWAKDSTADACPLCNKKFSLFNRRHHCRQCGTVACGDCSASTKVIESLGKKEPVRVCDKCKNNA